MSSVFIRGAATKDTEECVTDYQQLDYQQLDNNLHTWRNIRSFLDRLDRDEREPDPWEVHFAIEAIASLSLGEGNPRFIDAAGLPASRRVPEHEQPIVNESDHKVTKADLRAAFRALPVPGGHPG